MSDYLFYILDVFSLLSMGVCIFLIVRIRKKIFLNKIFLSYIFFSIMISFFAFRVHVNSAYVIKLSRFSEEVDTLIGYYLTKSGTYPNNIDDFLNDTYVNGEMVYLFYPFDLPRLKIQISQINDTTSTYLIYYFGFDNDDDQLKNTYTLDYGTAFNIWIDGDVIIEREEVDSRLISKTIRQNRI